MKFVFAIALFFVSFSYGSCGLESFCILGSPVIEDHFNKAASPFVMIDFNHQDAQGNTGLHNAVIAKDLVLVKRLCLSGANIAIKNNKDQSPLSLAFWMIQSEYSDVTKEIHKFLRSRL